MRKHGNGFGLLEAGLTLGLLVLMGSSTAYLMGTGKAEPGPEGDAAKGALLAKVKMDSLRSESYAELSAGCDTVSSRFIRRWYVSTDRTTERKRLEMLISWPLSAHHTLTFTTLVGNDAYKSR
jgi:hypothetical protein